MVAESGLRCLGFAYRKVDDTEQRAKGSSPGGTDALLGYLVGLKDTCRPEVNATIEDCTKASAHGREDAHRRYYILMALTYRQRSAASFRAMTLTESLIEGHQFRGRVSDTDNSRWSTRSVSWRVPGPKDKLLLVKRG
ncbi:hypothetical protein ZWY2020_027907 [Hordeum vulgare]|nr:hypothetical protein ZWY2020_027907 [Hordeum vulgare]